MRMRWIAGLIGLLVVAWAVLYSIGIRSSKEGETAPPDAQLSPRVWKEQMRGWKKAQKILQNGGNIGKPKFPYKGPQTAESIMKAFDAKWRRMNPERATLLRYSPENVKMLLERALERGAVVNDYDDYIAYAQTLSVSIKSSRTHDDRLAELPLPPPGFEGLLRITIREELGLPESASWEEVDNAIIDNKIRKWLPQKIWQSIEEDSGDPITYARLLKSGDRYKFDASDPRLSAKQRYLITHHGVAPEDMKAYYLDQDKRILPPDQVRLNNWDDGIAKMSDADWRKSMRFYYELFTPAAADKQDWAEVDWMINMDYYAALMRSMETRGKSAPFLMSKTAEEHAAAYRAAVDAFFEKYPQLNEETRRIYKQRQK